MFCQSAAGPDPQDSPRILSNSLHIIRWQTMTSPVVSELSPGETIQSTAISPNPERSLGIQKDRLDKLVGEAILNSENPD